MLTNLNIKNLAVINNMNIHFCSGLNVFTGETGAGKSIILKALSFIMGTRCSKDVVRFGEQSATIEATFEGLSTEILKIIDSFGISLQDSGKKISIKRIIYCDGKSKALINSSAVNVGDLKEIGQKLINFNEQGSNLNILNLDNNVNLLDSFAEINELVLKYRENFVEVNDILKQLKQIQIKIEQKNETFDELKSQIFEIEQVNMKPDEDLKISKQLKIIRNSAEIFETLELIYEFFNGGYENDGVLSGLNVSVKQLEKISKFSDEFSGIFEKFKNLVLELEEIVFEIEKIKNKLNFEPKTLEFLENRLSQIVKLKRKFGSNFQEIENKLVEMKFKLNKMQNYESKQQELIKLKDRKLINLKKQLLEISSKRKEAATMFSNAVLSELQFLEMKHSKFVIDLKKHKANLNGLEDVEFLISANLGEPLKPVAEVASGGELSRISLAIISVIAEKFKQPTLVFDEIDSGVSGVAAKKIGTKLKQLSKNTQIICITHLAQIASIADEHFKIFKSIDENGRISSKILNLDFDEKIKEIARLIDGNEDNQLVLNLAAEMIKQNN